MWLLVSSSERQFWSCWEQKGNSPNFSRVILNDTIQTGKVVNILFFKFCYRINPRELGLIDKKMKQMFLIYKQFISFITWILIMPTFATLANVLVKTKEKLYPLIPRSSSYQRRYNYSVYLRVNQVISTYLFPDKGNPFLNASC